MQTFLVILQTTIPALVVFATAYYLIKEFFKNEYHLRAMQLKTNQQDTTVPMKFSALERFALLTERMQLPNTVLRVTQGMDPSVLDAQTLYYAMLINTQQEFEHNIAQQIYISPELWDIIRGAKQDTVNTLTYLYQALPQSAKGSDFIDVINEYHQKSESRVLDIAQLAIKKEASLVLP
jgi:hypothetical protein